MSLREEDRQKNNCPSRGLGLAAAAIGVGVGAALYYFFSKRPENPDTEGSTQEWQCEAPENFRLLGSFEHSDEDSYTTISEHSTTDTSIFDNTRSSFIHSMEADNDSYDSDISLDDSLVSVGTSDQSSTFQESVMSIDSIDSRSSISIIQSLMSPSSLNESGMSEDSQSSSLDLMSEIRDFMETSIEWFLPNLLDYSPRSEYESFEQQQLNDLRAQAFRERSWSLEECSICFEVILKDQEVMGLPCTHHFHTSCILPWLQEQQTCPNCRKAVD